MAKNDIAEPRDNPYAFVRCNDKCEGGFEVYSNNDR